MKSRILCAAGYPLCLLGLYTLPLAAADWTTGAYVTPGVTYTDNVCLSADNEKDQWIGLVTPGGEVRADGNRANLDITGSVEINTLSDSKLENLGCNGQGVFGSRDQFAPRLAANADAIIVENWLYIDSNAIISQNSVTPFASGGGDSLNRTGNTNTTYYYTVSPYVSRRFGDTALLNLRYTWDDQYNSENIVGDSSEQRVDLSLGSVPGVARLSWGVQGDYSRVSYADTPGQLSNKDSELKSARLSLGYQFSRAWQLNGFVGDEWNDFISNQDEIDGSLWDIGLRWTPNLRTTVEVGTGDRFFGTTPRFSIEHRHKRSAFNASYIKELTYNRNIRALGDSPPLDPGFGPPPGVDPGVTTTGRSPTLDERFTLGYVYQGLRSNFGVSAFQSDQTQQGSSLNAGSPFQESIFRGASVSFRRSLSRQISLTAELNWNEQEPKDQELGILSDSETWIGRLRAQHQLNQRLNLSLEYQYTDRQSDNTFNTYTENRMTLDLRVDL